MLPVTLELQELFLTECDAELVLSNEWAIDYVCSCDLLKLVFKRSITISQIHFYVQNYCRKREFVCESSVVIGPQDEDTSFVLPINHSVNKKGHQSVIVCSFYDNSVSISVLIPLGF